MAASPPDGHGITRRGFLLGAACGLGLGVPLSWLAARRLPLLVPTPAWTPPETTTATSGVQPSDVMPGRYPGRVIEVRHPAAVSPDNLIDAGAVDDMVDRGMAELTGYETGDLNAWK